MYIYIYAERLSDFHFTSSGDIGRTYWRVSYNLQVYWLIFS